MLKPRVSAFLSLLLVFVSGALVGGLGYRWYSVNNAPPDRGSMRKGPPPTPDEIRRHQEDVKKRILADLVRDVKVDSQQQAQISQILDDVRVQFGQIHDGYQDNLKAMRAKQIERINEVLRPEQRPLYEQWRAKRDAERKKRNGSIQQDSSKK